MSQKFIHRASGRVGLLGALALAGAALVLAPVAQAHNQGGGGGSHGGGGGGGSHGGGGGSHGGASHGGGGMSRGGSFSSSSRGTASSRGWVTHSGSHYSSSHYSSSARTVAGHSASQRVGGRSGYGYRGGRGYGYGHGSNWGWNYWGWGWGWGWAPYWSTWWWGGPWGGTAIYVAPGSSDVGARSGRYATVKTDVTPEEAQVYLDGKYIGTADDFDGFPDYLYLGPGTYHVEFRLPNYQSYVTDMEVTRGEQVRIQQTLKLEPGKSALDSFSPESKGTPLGRVFTKGGDSTQAAPRGDDGWSDREAPPAYRDREAPPAYAPRDRGDDDRMDARAAPAPRPANRGRIKFRVTPDDAAVYMDDKYLGAADDLAANERGVVAEPGTHSITVTRPGYKSKTVEVTARASSPIDVVVELEK